MAFIFFSNANHNIPVFWKLQVKMKKWIFKFSVHQGEPAEVPAKKAKKRTNIAGD